MEPKALRERMIVHMDVDTGVDDALAILMALHIPEVRLVGISTVAGNTSARQAAVNTAFLLHQLGIDVPVFVGDEQTCDGKPVNPVPSVHGEDGLGGVTTGWIAPANPRSTGSADAIVHAARRYGPELNLLLTGPVTNLARALIVAPRDVARIGSVLVMAGSILEGGNITPFAEFNALSDPRALEIVLASGLPITLIPLDVTHKVRLLRCEWGGGMSIDPDLSALLQRVTATYMGFHHSTSGFDGCLIHDPLTVAALVRPDLFAFEKLAVSVITEGEEAGRTIGTRPSGTAATIEAAMGVNPEGCLKLFWGAIGRATLGPRTGR